MFMAVRAFGTCDNKQTSLGWLESVIELLLEQGADVHCKNAHDRTALHIAVKYASAEVVDMFIARGADINQRSSNGATPLHLAVQFDNLMQVKLLLARGADVNVSGESL